MLLPTVCFKKQFMEQTVVQNVRWSYSQKPGLLPVVPRQADKASLAI